MGWAQIQSLSCQWFALICLNHAVPNAVPGERDLGAFIMPYATGSHGRLTRSRYSVDAAEQESLYFGRQEQPKWNSNGPERAQICMV
jgi:hypothetical protein